MVKKYSDKELQNMSIPELERLKSELQSGYSDSELQNMSISELERLKKDLQLKRTRPVVSRQ
jgi:hypothetical protein